eukprot:UN06961
MSTLKKTMQFAENDQSTTPKYTTVTIQNIDGVDAKITSINDGVDKIARKKIKKKIYIIGTGISVLVSIIFCISIVLLIVHGIHNYKIGNSYNVELLCECTDVSVKEETECYTSRGEPQEKPTRRCDTEYTAYYIVSVVDYYDNTACSDASSVHYMSFSEDIEDNSHVDLFCIEGEEIKCFTNDECDELFLDENNTFHGKAIAMYFLAGFLCVIEFCFLGSAICITRWCSYKKTKRKSK